MKLADILVSLAGIYSFTFLVMAIEFQQDCRRCRFVNRPKTFRRYIVECTVQQHTLRIRIIPSFIIRQTGYYGILAQSSESAIIEDVTMVIPGISNPHESTIAGKGAVIEVGWTSSQNRDRKSVV